MKFIFNWFVAAIAIIISAYLLPGVAVDGIWVALVLAVVLGAINAFIKPVLLLLTLPITIVTLGLFSFVVNALLILLAELVVPGFDVAGFWWALIFSLVLSVVTWVLGRFNR